MVRSAFVPAVFTAALMLIGFTGCGGSHPGIVPVKGKVTIDGKPVTTGQVYVYAEGQRPATGKIQQDGTFQLSSFAFNDGAPTGTHLATVSAVEGVDDRTNRWHAPKKYASETSSELWVTIDGPTDDLNIELTWNGSGQSAPYVDKF
ncbi:hypothetical protein [Aeoliella sp. SH292]|uniref:hypothetical protein n=1 Tax=Aeoliella sp. SH292 TaxID=3454464 RepID=UPI003F9DE48C